MKRHLEHDTTMTLPILIVDDDPGTAAIMVKRLIARGYEADSAENGEAALEKVRLRPYGLAIVDYLMPGMDGVELVRRMREVRSETVAIFLTGHTTIDVVFPAIEAGVLRVLAKPVNFQELLPIVEAYVGKAA
jgi:DNA-binding response OmpR family regulator